MTETHPSGHEDQKPVPEKVENAPQGSAKGEDVIELSDIAVGISREDDVIVELTEEIIGEAFVGFSGATSEVIQEDEEELDLSRARPERDGAVAAVPENLSETGAGVDDSVEDEISRELDDYFGTEEDRPPVVKAFEDGSRTTEPPAPARPGKAVEFSQGDEIRISATQLDEAVERVVRKLFAEKINRILDDVIERTVSEEISQLKDYLLGVSGKK